MGEKVDLLIKNVNVYNSYFKTFEIADVSILEGKFYYIDKKNDANLLAKKVIDGTGKIMIPSFVDIHMHIESSMMTPKVFCNHLVSCGVTTIVSEPHEIANVKGLQGVLDMIEAGKECPIDIFYGIPSCVPSTNKELETTGGIIDFPDMKLLLENNKIICVGEIMNYRGIIRENNLEIGKFLKYIHKIKSNIVIEGHCPSLTGLDLAKFLYLGINGDHTEHNIEELRQRFENGSFVEIQEKMLSKEFFSFAKKYNLYEYFGFVTDDVMADVLYEQGQLDAIVRKAIALGLEPKQAIYNATYTNSRRMNLLDRGVIAPGKKADFILLTDLKTIDIQATYKDGKCVYSSDCLNNHEVKKLNNRINDGRKEFAESYYHSIKLEALELNKFQVAAEGKEGSVKIKAIEICDGSTKTKEKVVNLLVKNNLIDWENSECRLAMVVERYGKEPSIGYGFICGDILKKGAVATSYAHDSHNLLIVGSNAKDMQIVANRVIDVQGGIVTAVNGKITAQLALPVGGILSEEPIENISCNLKQVRTEMEKQGYRHYNPIMSLCTITLPVSPKLKLTNKGLVDVVKGEIVSMFV